ncbi:hypothetical protein HPB48_011230 [Haemaphysalis longicornis]|uniref:Exonuclease domain-containing protein n=1 Tax=Haemaphysalis longicornis TaxID=44386 RepID=A0A9J6GKG1_HAELO|nr:hypothetical protein HPB48_011230 [Haemaphysalis longicornis]
MAEQLGFLTGSVSAVILSAPFGALIPLLFFVPRKKEDDAKQKPSETDKEEEKASKDRKKDRDKKGQRPSSRKTATRQGERAPARDVDVHLNRKYPVAAGDHGPFLQDASSAEDDLQKPSADSICSATRRSAGQLADTSPLRLRTHGLYDQLLRYVLSPQEPDRCGCPRLCPEKPGRLLFMHWGEKASSSRKTGSRCRSSFVITHSGDAKSARFFPTGRCSAIGFSCCGASADHPGCDSSYYHVRQLGARDNKWDTAALDLVRPRRLHGGAREVFALDCEMRFTIRGFEVARASVVDSNGATVYDAYARPESPVVGYSAAFSVITAAHLRNVNTTLQGVQAALPVLVGHGLENDLRVLRLVHDSVVDMTVVFPHHRGLPCRRSLDNDYVNRGVPNGPLGHDSVEDVKACMKLMLWKAAHDQELRDRLSWWPGGRYRQPSE